LAADRDDEAQLGIQSCGILGFEDQIAAGYVWALVREGVGHSELLAQQVDERTQFRHRDPVGTPVLPKQAGFDELRPRHGPGAAWLDPNDRHVLLAAPTITLQPIVQRRRRHTKQAGRLSLGVHLAFQDVYHGASLASGTPA
jgi:hypothetical protein